MVVELLDRLLDFVVAYCILRLDCRKRYSGYSVVHGAVTSLHNCSSHLMVPKMILRLDFVDLADHITSSILTRLGALSESSVPSGGAHP